MMNDTQIDTAKEIRTGGTDRLLTMATQRIIARLSDEEIAQAFDALLHELELCDPQYRDPIEINVAGETLWGVVEPWAGPHGEDLLTLTLPERLLERR